MKESSSGRKHQGRRVHVRVTARRLSCGWGGGGHTGAVWERAGLNGQRELAPKGGMPRRDGAEGEAVCPTGEDGCGQAQKLLQS